MLGAAVIKSRNQPARVATRRILARSGRLRGIPEDRSGCMRMMRLGGGGTGDPLQTYEGDEVVTLFGGSMAERRGKWKARS